MKQEFIKFIKEKYPDESAVAAQIDEVIPEYLDDDWEEEYESEYDAYIETGNGEAENHISSELSRQFLTEHGITEDDYYNKTGEQTWDTITELYDILDK